jgi:hypothetical protein
MKIVNVEKNALLEILKGNAAMHEVVYAESLEAFKTSYAIELSAMLAKATTTGDYQMHINLSKPANHSEDYSDAIRMVELENNPIIPLSHEEFCAYVLNKWNWMTSFESIYRSNIGYSGFSGYSGYSDTANKFFNK